MWSVTPRSSNSPRYPSIQLRNLFKTRYRWNRAEQTEPLHAELPQRAQAQRRRIGRSLPSGKRPRRSQGGQLAANDAKRQVHPHAAALLAEGDTTVDPRRHLEATADPASDCTIPTPRRALAISASCFRTWEISL